MMKLLHILTICFSAVSLMAQSQVYTIEQVDTLPTFQACPSHNLSEMDDWLACFYTKLEGLVSDTIKQMEQEVGMTFKGQVKVSFDVDETGKVENINILNKPHPIIKKGVKDILGGLQDLKPAQKDGQVVGSNLTIEFVHNEIVVEELPKAINYNTYDLKEVDRPPFIASCEIVGDIKNSCKCSSEQFSVFFREVKYPAYARENGITGTVEVSYVIERDGTMAEMKIEKDIGGGCGQEALSALRTTAHQLGSWIPAQKNEQVVRCKVTLPVRFYFPRR